MHHISLLFLTIPNSIILNMICQEESQIIFMFYHREVQLNFAQFSGGAILTVSSEDTQPYHSQILQEPLHSEQSKSDHSIALQPTTNL